MKLIEQRAATAIVASLMLLSGCTAIVRTNQTEAGAAKTVPSERRLAYQTNSPQFFRLDVTRDEGFMGGGCYIALEIDGALAGRFDTEEMGTFYVPSATPKLRVIPDPMGKGLCALGGWNPVAENYKLIRDKPNRYRISLGAYRRPRLLPMSY